MRTAIYFFALTLLSSGGLISCKKGDNDLTPDPVKISEPSYFAGYTFEPKELDDDETRLLVSFCKETEPADTEIGVYEFDPGTNGDNALADLLIPHYDDDGELIDRDDPDYYTQVKAKYVTPEGTKVSDFNKQKQFAVDVDRNSVVILTWEDKNGFLSSAVVNAAAVSRETPAQICLKSN